MYNDISSQCVGIHTRHSPNTRGGLVWVYSEGADYDCRAGGPPPSHIILEEEKQKIQKKYGKKNFECSILLGQQSTAQTNTQKIIATCHGR